MPKISIDTQQLLSERDRLSKTLQIIEEQLAMEKVSDAPVNLLLKRQEIEERLQVVNQKIESFIVADTAVETVESIAGNVAGDLETLRNLDADSTKIEALEKQIRDLAETSRRSIEQLRSSSLTSGLEPRMSVIRPNIRLVDANLAYKYADLQSDVNILLGFTTLFIGTGISAAVSLAVSLATKTSTSNHSEDIVISIYVVITIMSFLVSLIFGYLTNRYHKKAEEIKRKLETDSGEKEVLLRIATEVSDPAKEESNEPELSP
ncbi:MAG: hypothetical protein CVU44_10560 [Chloroflexi bacterium HGW-Chloroflexi-6]|nr:MAG: hypothetical protein CVU44_10560 [Chloroflexi bacterium HGW-Chloroflexi-6]